MEQDLKKTCKTHLQVFFCTCCFSKPQGWTNNVGNIGNCLYNMDFLGPTHLLTQLRIIFPVDYII